MRLSATIDVVEHLGGSSFAYGPSGTQEPLTIEMKEGRDIAEGAMLQTGFSAAKAFLFDPQSGQRLR